MEGGKEGRKEREKRDDTAAELNVSTDLGEGKEKRHKKKQLCVYSECRGL